MSETKGLHQVPRRTAQKDAVLAALVRMDAFISAQDLCDHLSTGPLPVSLATVYRHLNTFVELGQADTIWRDRHQLFRACGGAASHVRAVCSTCGEESELAPPPDLLADVTKSRGFVVEHIAVEIVGRCNACPA